MSGRGGIYRGPNGEKLHGDGREVIASPVPDRVIDAPTGVCGCGHIKSVHRDGGTCNALDDCGCFKYKPTTPAEKVEEIHQSDAPIPEHIDAMLPKDLAIHCIELEAKIARLEAEKQEAHTEGWNACVDAAAELAYTHEEAGLVGAIMGLAKPTAAKQGDPS